MTITIIHSYADGTMLDGTTREDTARGTDAREVLHRNGWKWAPSIEAWAVRGSRWHAPQRQKIQATADGLREAGFDVAVDINVEVTVDDVATAEEERHTRAEDRADMYAERAARHEARSEALHQAETEMGRRIPFGQPVLEGHHSERRDRRYRARMHAKGEQSRELAMRAERERQRLDTVTTHAAVRDTPTAVAARIEQRETDLRRGNVRADERPQREAELEYWRAVRQRQIAEGQAPVYSKDTIRKGDLVQRRNRAHSWERVVRVNAKSVSVGLWKEQSGKWNTTTVPYHQITAHRSVTEKEDAA